jgi:SAM-dependent methyltransferase
MKKALLQYSKQKFSEMQITHQQSHSQQSSSLLAAPISPTPNDIITVFLQYLGLGPDSLLVDLGCGDGRWLMTASKLTRCTCLGIDIDEERLDLAKQFIQKERLGEQVQVCKQDVFEFLEKDNQFFPKMDVLIIYLFRDAMLKIGSTLQQRFADLKQEVKILCVGFALPHWKAIRIEKCCGLTVYMYYNLTI